MTTESKLTVSVMKQVRFRVRVRVRVKVRELP
jgi:hypothetical protein